MGILDDAIREHLELKRQHGAESDDLERLESEAFGPATRPGDPEYSTGESPAVSRGRPPKRCPRPSRRQRRPADSSTTAASPASRRSGAPPRRRPHASFRRRRLPRRPLAPTTPNWGETADHPAPPSAEEPPSMEEPLPVEDPSAPIEAPPAPVEAPPAPGGDTNPPAEEPPEAPEHAIFDSGEIDFGDLDLELEDHAPPEPATPTPPTSLSKPLDQVPDVPLPDTPLRGGSGRLLPRDRRERIVARRSVRSPSRR